VVAAGGSPILLHAETICIHGETPGAVEIAAAVHWRLRQAGVTIQALPGGK
jgi:5-oxoprolinase (ATP-hydrolysing) subunit A